MCNLCYQSRLLKQRKYVPNFKHWSNVICSAPKVMTRLGRATQMDVGFTNFGLGDDWRHLYTFWVMIPEFYFCHFLCSLQQDIIVITFFFKSPVILPQLFLDETNLKIRFANVILAHTLPVWLMRIQKAIICKKNETSVVNLKILWRKSCMEGQQASFKCWHIVWSTVPKTTNLWIVFLHCYYAVAQTGDL